MERRGAAAESGLRSGLIFVLLLALLVSVTRAQAARAPVILTLEGPSWLRAGEEADDRVQSEPSSVELEVVE